MTESDLFRSWLDFPMPLCRADICDILWSISSPRSGEVCKRDTHICFYDTTINIVWFVYEREKEKKKKRERFTAVFSRKSCWPQNEGCSVVNHRPCWGTCTVWPQASISMLVLSRLFNEDLEIRKRHCRARAWSRDLHSVLCQVWQQTTAITAMAAHSM